MNALGHYTLTCFLLCASPPILAPRDAVAQRNAWVATWASSPESTNPNPNLPMLNLENQTVRQRVRVSIGGPQICIRLSNEYGSVPLLVGAVTVATPTDAASVRPDTIQNVTFSKRNSIMIPPGAPVLSDPVVFPVSRGAQISISIYFPKRVSTPTVHELALKRAVISQPGDETHAEKIDRGATSKSSILISAVLVPAQPSQHLVVAFGDSIVDGDQSTVDADHNWTSDLVRRWLKSSETPELAVVNEGLAGNRLLSNDDGVSARVGLSTGFGASALARFDRDGLSLPGVTHIVLLEGINDIGFPGAKIEGRYLADPAEVRTSEDLIGAYLQLISRAHAHGMKLIGSTITPCEGVDLPGYYSEAKEAVRQAVNQWIRTSGAFDGVIDFDAVLRDPEHPSRMLPRFSSPDHLHPNDAGYQAMADAIDLALFN
ncbi:MAG TPA: SGNH/GDSL hydrolase family protein [Terriglobales bacterium]|nr:SGNH/GDSL hydrolase family protein [Terriglobales bacterium]